MLLFIHRAQQQALSASAERETQLRTQAMREAEKQQGKRKYRFALLRVRMPNALMLQGGSKLL
jgi:hypothetical protein